MKKNKNVSRLVCLFFPLFMWLPLDANVTKYEVRNQGIIIGYVNNVTDANKAYDSLKRDMNMKYSNVKFPDKNITFRIINDDTINPSSLKEIEENLKKTLDIEVDAYDTYFNGSSIGIISSKDDGDRILRMLADKYIDELKIDRKCIKNVSIDTDSYYKKIRAQISEIISYEDAVAKIKHLNNDKRIVDVNIDIIKDVPEIKMEDTIIIPDNNMYMGQRRVIKGCCGKVVVNKEIRYVNGKKQNERIIDQHDTIPTLDTIIYTGTKSPIADGVPFLQRPSRGVVTSGYGRRYGSTHHGIDIGAGYGSSIGAALDGIVNETGYNSIYGYYLKIDHGSGIETLYGHSSKILVKKGDKVNRGQTIALVGSTGNSTGPHIHFELRSNGVAINPTKYIK